MNKIYYTYGDMKLDLSVIYDSYLSKFATAPDIVVGLTRGGLVPAVHLSHMFNVPMLPLQWSSRDFAKKDEFALERLIDRAYHGTRLLIVDDIFDTGETLVEVAKEFREGYVSGSLPVYATLIANNTAPRFKKFIEEEILLMGSYMDKELTDWVVFPWET